MVTSVVVAFLAPLALISAFPIPLPPDGSAIPLYIDHPIYFHEVVNAYPARYNSAENSITDVMSQITLSADSPSFFHDATPVQFAPKPSTQVCQHYRHEVETVPKWLERIYHAVTSHVTGFVAG